MSRVAPAIPATLEAEKEFHKFHALSGLWMQNQSEWYHKILSQKTGLKNSY